MGKRGRRARKSPGTPGKDVSVARNEADLSMSGPGSTEPLPGRRRVPWRLLSLIGGGLLVASLSALAVWEMRTSTLQARYFSSVAARLAFDVGTGSGETIRFPDLAPYDVRYGYHALPDVLEALASRAFVVEEQARQSDDFVAWMDRGLFPIYREKGQAGLEILDANGESLFRSQHPGRVFQDFESVPPLVWRTLLFVENRSLLDARFPHRNPAVEWSRLGRVGLDVAGRALGSDRPVPGGSTLATQIEKYRHSPRGRTDTSRDKLVQMWSASTRAYMDGPVTLPSRQRTLVDYLNTVPLAGISGAGEIAGLGDGLWAWFGADLDEVSHLLRDPHGEDEKGSTGADAAKAYRQVLMLILAVQRPSYLLGTTAGREALEARALRFLGPLADAGVISPSFGDDVASAQVSLRATAPPAPEMSFIDRKASDAVRSQLLPLTGISSLYALDRFDLTVATTFHKEVQDSITALLRNLTDADFVQAHGLRSFRLLERGDPAGVYYTFVLHELAPGGNLVRVQAENYDAPFRLTGGAKLELGSTAKLRAMVTYLEVVDALYREYSAIEGAALRAIEVGTGDAITRWALDWLARTPGASLEQMLEAALDRTYSANPGERFFTGGGVHSFVNFDRVHDGQVLSVRESFRHSVNLPFIRLMRDVVHYHIHRLPGYPARILSDRSDPRRLEYLNRFADGEGQVFLGQFYRKHQGWSVHESMSLLIEGRTLTPTRMAWAFRSVLPSAEVGELEAFVRLHSDGVEIAPARIAELHRRSDPATVPLVDQGYLAGVHPLELWLVRYLADNPTATRAEIMEASRDVRQEVYGWLFNTRRSAAQDQRIRSIMEAEAFREIHRSWRRLGYPFESLVPSYATAIGSSADRPDALTELVGILLADGLRSPTRMITAAHFAADTPFETRLRRAPVEGERVLSAEVARAIRGVMTEVVERGTAVRARNSVWGPDGAPLVIGAKTGTGNNRHRTYGTGGRLIEDRALNRTSTLVFFIGDRFYGSITAFAPGPSADDYGFTSSLPSQILRMAGPMLTSLLR